MVLAWAGGSALACLRPSQRKLKNSITGPRWIKSQFLVLAGHSNLVREQALRFNYEKPGWFFGLLKMMNNVKLVNASIFKFVNYYIGDAEVRRLLYSRWTSLRKIKPDLPVIKNLIRENKTTVRLIYGKHDRIILSSTGEQFKKELKNIALSLLFTPVTRCCMRNILKKFYRL